MNAALTLSRSNPVLAAGTPTSASSPSTRSTISFTALEATKPTTVATIAATTAFAAADATVAPAIATALRLGQDEELSVC